MRAAALLLVLLCLAPAAQATLTLSVAAPAEPIPLDGSQNLVVTVGLDCADLVLRGGEVEVALSLAPTAPFTLDGPASLKASATACAAGAPPTWTGAASYAIRGSPFIPGLVPHPVHVTATIPAAPAVAGAESRSASANVTPKALVNYTFEPVLVLPSDNRGEAVPIRFTLTSRSNVALGVSLQAAGGQSEDLTRNAVDPSPLPQGSLTVPANLTLPAAALDGQPSATDGVALFQAPPGRAGVDRFRLVAQARPTLDPAAPPDGRSAQVEVRFDLRPVLAMPDGSPNTASDAPAGRIGHAVTPSPPEAPAPAVALVLAVLGLAAARRRAREVVI